MIHLKKNKGAALVAVLIGILFISILASSLLYMSTVNFKMKSMRQFSSDNFYTAEFGLNDMLSQIKQYCKNSPTGNPQDDLKTLLNGGSGQFNRTALQNMIKVDSNMVPGLDSITVGSIYDGTGQPTYAEVGNYIYLYGVTVTAKTTSGYESSITTDIAFGFPPTSGDKGKLNDFSILSDSPLQVGQSNQVITGNVYLRQNGQIGTNALQIDEKGLVTMLSTFAFLQGDLQIKDGGVLYIAGSCVVNGSVIVESGGQLVVGGDLTVRNGISGSYKLSGSGTLNGQSIDWSFYDTNYNSGLAGKLVSDKIYFHLSDSEATMYGYEGTKKKLELTQQQFFDYIQDSNETLNTATLDGVTVSAVYLKQPVIHKFKDTLLVGMGSSHFDNDGGVENCTYLNVSGSGLMQCYIQDKFLNWGTMDDKSYAAALKLFLVAGNKGNFGSDGTVTFASSGQSQESINNGSLTGVTEYAPGYYYNDSSPTVNYIPFSAFLNDDVGDILGGFMQGSTSGGGSSSAQPTIIISNWTKE